MTKYEILNLKVSDYIYCKDDDASMSVARICDGYEYDGLGFIDGIIVTNTASGISRFISKDDLCKDGYIKLN